jgi:GNAT superfamily N-acetyltransferase
MLTLHRTDSSNADFQALVAQLDRYLTGQNGEADAFYSQFNTLDAIRHAVVAYVDGVPVGCGALKPFGPGVAEVKRMYVDPAHRGRGIAGRVLAELENWGRELSFSACVLETARGFADAVGLYTKHGYRPIPNYGPYVGVANSVCLRKELRPS